MEKQKWNDLSELEKREAYDDYVMKLRQEHGDYAEPMPYAEFDEMNEGR